jgi:hypothetical protein
VRRKFSHLLKELFYLDLELMIDAFLLLIDISKLLQNTVATVPSVTLAIEKPSYDHGDTVNVSGTVLVDEAPQAGAEVSVTLTDAADKVTDLGTVVTDAEGNFKASVKVPADTAPGSVTVTASAIGATATATFTCTQKNSVPSNGVTKK